MGCFVETRCSVKLLVKHLRNTLPMVTGVVVFAIQVVVSAAGTVEGQLGALKFLLKIKD
jgi:hypothetical protein